MLFYKKNSQDIPSPHIVLTAKAMLKQYDSRPVSMPIIEGLVFADE